MCLILHTTKKIGLPDDATLNRMFRMNPDGAGIVSVYHNASDNNHVYTSLRKGIMVQDEFISAVKSEFARLTTDEDYIIAHTRIATSGGKAPERTHPFKTPSGGYLFHNGICSAVLGKLNANQSDTEYLADNFTTLEEVSKLDTTSRYAYITPSGKVRFLGTWITDKEGRRWSNDGYKEYTYTYPYYGGHYYDDYDDDGFGRPYRGSTATVSYYLNANEIAAYRLMCKEAPDYAADVFNFMRDMDITYSTTGGFSRKNEPITFEHLLFDNGYAFTMKTPFNELKRSTIIYSIPSTGPKGAFDVYKLEIIDFLNDMLALTGYDKMDAITPLVGTKNPDDQLPLLSLGVDVICDVALIKKDVADFIISEINTNISTFDLPFKLYMSLDNKRVMLTYIPPKKEEKTLKDALEKALDSIDVESNLDKDDDFASHAEHPLFGKSETEMVDYIKKMYTREYGLDTSLSFSVIPLQDKSLVQLACLHYTTGVPVQKQYMTKTLSTMAAVTTIQYIVSSIHQWVLGKGEKQ